MHIKMDNERFDIAPAFSFKPVDDDGNSSVLSTSSSSSDDVGNDNLLMMGVCLPTEIFRFGSDSTPPKLGKPRPTRDDFGAADDVAAAFRVISPYPFSHTSSEEISEREHLSNALRLTLESHCNKDDHQTTTRHEENDAIQVEYFNCSGPITDENDVEMEECDDFSVSLQDADSLSTDLGLEDPASFWEDGASAIPSSIFIMRTKSPTEISLGSDDEAPLRPKSNLVS